MNARLVDHRRWFEAAARRRQQRGVGERDRDAS